MRKKANIFLVTMVLIAIVCTSLIYQIWQVHVPKAKNNPIEQTVQEANVINHSVEQQIQAFVWPKVQPYEGEQRYPVIKKTPHPIPKYKSDIYLEYNTSRYIDDNGLIYIPSDDVLGNMTRNELTELYYSYIENIQVTCPRMRHIGNDRDGGYHVCEPALPRDCLAYSFGNRKDYSFDDGLAFHYNCEVHSFDPNDGQPDHRHGELVEFHKLGIGGRDEIINYNWTVKTLDSIRILLGHEDRPLDLLKVDIEGGEWSCFPQMLLTNVLERAHVKLLMVEFHMRFIKQNKAAYLNGLHILKGIYDAGFRIYFFRIWTLLCQKYDKITGKLRILCHEVHFVRI